MELFHFHKQRRFKHRLQQRQEYAELIGEHLEYRKQLPTDLHLIALALYAAEKDEPLFNGVFNEQMPPHLQAALYFEITLWTRLRESLEALAKTSNDEDEYRRRAQGFKTTCQALSKVLTLEKQILFSPLTKTFTEKLDEIKSSWG
jgi:hypothetical protein